jgi:hypothetical protein
MYVLRSPAGASYYNGAGADDRPLVKDQPLRKLLFKAHRSATGSSEEHVVKLSFGQEAGRGRSEFQVYFTLEDAQALLFKALEMTYERAEQPKETPLFAWI